MTSLRRSGSRLLRMTTRLLAQVAAAPKPAKPPKAAKPRTAAPRPTQPQAARPARTLAFSPNPGSLSLHIHVPARLAPMAPLVVLLHGCGQDPETFATQTGWRALADRHGFALLMPGQSAANNRQGCFNWFRPADTGRDLGEAGSIAAMIRAVVQAHRCDPARVFATGLSAGGAMTACLLASYPDLFAAGAVVAGLPAGSAGGVVGAMTRMAGRGAELSAADWMVRARSLAPIGYAGAWPRLAIIHGDADMVVAPVNGSQLALQWSTLLGAAVHETLAPVQPGIMREVWRDPAGAPAVELWRVAGMGHVYPTAKSGGLAASREIARFWGLIG